MKKILAVVVVALVVGCEDPQLTATCGNCLVPVVGPQGFDAVVQVVPASTCAAGGYSLLTATDTNRNGVADSADSNFSLVEVCNGEAGNDGADGNDSILALVDPCGDSPGAHDEVLIRLSDGRLLASFSNNANGDYTRFSVLVPGVNYMTTDGTGCYFSVDASNVVYNEHF